MALYRANPADGVVWITGGATGIGRAVALQLAERGFTVVVSGRDADPAIAALTAAKEFSDRLFDHPCDVRDAEAMARAVNEIEERYGPITLALLNAGQYIPVMGERLNVHDFRQTYEVNLFGIINGMVPLSERMQRRGGGQIVMMGSVASYFGLPSTAAYGATKAAINVMAESLRYDFDRMNIRLQVINPGFIHTALSRRSPFAMPGLMNVNSAAARIIKAMNTDRFEVSFPRRLTWTLKLLNLTPHRLRRAVIARATRPREQPLQVKQSAPAE
ncbi:SDR family NAD(P)-dependent oxidoreductase [Oryzicola mucosus]|uniref:SDR family NAD(P)-dependent oxidoreductase n=1 Tax=Oryzicola mucosus TaxID=2767425 RepID=A0A8J6U7P6_9HYPH|nr:SDR family NAD(P)-dependent oxidoreductase [Oryzicola mucosus]MBD0415017.1 SDR family NAD(P)-dependent oxidoreductase [Oryzicola mucosus]